MSTLENLDLQLQFHLAVCISYFAFCIWHLALCILHFAFCILHFTKFAGGKNRLFQTHSQSRCAIVLCCVGLQIELRVHLQHSIYICNRRWQKPRRLPLAALLNFILDTFLAKRRTMLAASVRFLPVGTYRMQTCLHQYWHIVGCPICLQTDK